MDTLRNCYDTFGKTRSVWLDDPEHQDMSEEGRDETVPMKDAAGRIIGFEKRNAHHPDGQPGTNVGVVSLPVPTPIRGQRASSTSSCCATVPFTTP